MATRPSRPVANKNRFDLTPPEENRARRIRILAFVGALGVCAFGVVIYFAAPSIGGAIKAWQSRRLAREAFALIDQEKWSEAEAKTRDALMLRPTEPQALRAAARFLSRTHQAEALDFWKQLAEKTSLTHEDRRDEAMIAIIAGDVSRADTAVRELIGSHPEPTDWLLAAQLSIQKNSRDEAKPYLERIVADSRATESEQFRAALLQFALAGDNRTQRANALACLKKLAEGKTATSLEALVILAQNVLARPIRGEGSVPSSAAADAAEGIPSAVILAQTLENHPLAKAQHKLLALDLRLHADPTQREALIGRAITDWKDAEPDDLVALADWLSNTKEFQKTLDTSPLEKAVQSRDLFLRYLDALGALGRWSEVKQLLNRGGFPLDPVVQDMYLARCSSRLGEKTAATNNWQRALEAAGGEVRKLMTLAEYAEKNENAQIAEAAYNGATTVAPKLRMAQDGRLRLAEASHDTKKLHVVLAGMLALWPDDPALENDEAYTRLLLMLSPESSKEEVKSQKSEAGASSEELNQIEQLAEKLVQQNSASLPHRTLLALARLRQNRATDAHAVYANIRVTANAVTPSAAAVHAAVLAATANTEDARTEAAQINPGRLLPEERWLIEPLLH